MAPDPASTRRSLIRSAEALFAERGIEAVSLREINAAAGQRNSSALQYHFGDRQGLLRAVLDKHYGAVDRMRHQMLDGVSHESDLRQLAAALVRPVAAKLDDPDGGRQYIRIYAELLNRPNPTFDPERLTRRQDGIARWRAMIAPLLPSGAAQLLHPRFTALRITASELARRAAGTHRRSDDLFVSHLIDIITAIMSVPVSEETEALLALTRRS